MIPVLIQSMYIYICKQNMISSVSFYAVDKKKYYVNMFCQFVSCWLGSSIQPIRQEQHTKLILLFMPPPQFRVGGAFRFDLVRPCDRKVCGKGVNVGYLCLVVIYCVFKALKKWHI